MTTKVKVKCGHCGQSIRVPEEKLGLIVRCPVCREQVLAVVSGQSTRTFDTRIGADGINTLSGEPGLTGTSVEESGGSMLGTEGSKESGTNALIGRFEVRRELGEGGFGKVYEAFDPQLGRTVALKVPTFGAENRRRVRRFITEARSAARLHHPNIVAVYENGQSEAGQLYIASEFVDGTTLKELLQSEDALLREKIAWIRDLAEALAYAHSEGIVHRDLKPENILVDRIHRRPKIVDFGLAKVLDELADGADAPLKTQDGVLGTPAFMAPEQARGELSNVGPHSDQYSLGSVLYQCITGHPPFQGSVYMIIAAVAGDEEPPSIRSLVPATPKDLIAICEKAMSKVAANRYEDLSQFAHDLGKWLNDEPVLARRTSRLTRFVRWCRRNPAIASMTGLVIAVLATSTIVLNSAFQRATVEKQNADRNQTLAEASAAQARTEAQRATEKEEEAKVALAAAVKARAEADAAKLLALSETERTKKAYDDLRLETNRADIATSTARVEAEKASLSERVAQDSRLAVLLEHGNTSFLKGTHLLQSEPATGLLWMVKALEELESQKNPNEPIERLKTLIRNSIAAELPRVPKLEFAVQLASSIMSPEHVAFSHDKTRVAVFAENTLSVRSTINGQDIYSSEVVAPIQSQATTVPRETSKQFGDIGCNGLFFNARSDAVAILSGSVYQIEETNFRPQSAESSNSGIRIHNLNSTKSPSSRIVMDAEQAPISWFYPTKSGAATAIMARGFNSEFKQFSSLIFFDDALQVHGEVAIDTLLPVTGVAASNEPAGVFIATGRTIRYLTRESGKSVPILTELGSDVQHVVVSPQNDYLAVALADHEVRLYQLKDMQFQVLPHGMGDVNSMSFSDDGTLLATAGSDSFVRVWICADGSPRTTPMLHPKPVLGVAFREDRLDTVCNDGYLRRWRLPDSKEAIPLQFAGIVAAEFSPDSRRLLVAQSGRNEPQSLTLFDLYSGTIIASAETSKLKVTDVEFARSGKVIVIAAGNVIQIQNATNLELIQTLRIPFQYAEKNSDSLRIKHIRVSDDAGSGCCLLTDGRVYVWSIQMNREPRLLETNPATSIAINGNGERMAIGYPSGEITLGDIKGNFDKKYSLPVSAPISSLCFSIDDRILAVGTKTGVELVLDSATGQVSSEHQGRAGSDVQQLSFLEDGRELAAISSSGINVWNLESRVETLQRTSEQSSGVLAISRSGQYCFIGDRVEFIPRDEIAQATALRKQLETSLGIRLTDNGLVTFINEPE